MRYAGGTRLPEGRRSIAKACVSVYVSVCVWGGVEYYNLTPECEDTHATSTAIKVLQSLEEHFVTACTLVKHTDKWPNTKTLESPRPASVSLRR